MLFTVATPGTAITLIPIRIRITTLLFTVAIIPSTAIPMEVATTRPTMGVTTTRPTEYCSTGETQFD